MAQFTSSRRLTRRQPVALSTSHLAQTPILLLSLFLILQIVLVSRLETSVMSKSMVRVCGVWHISPAPHYFDTTVDMVNGNIHNCNIASVSPSVRAADVRSLSPTPARTHTMECSVCFLWSRIPLPRQRQVIDTGRHLPVAAR